MGLIQAMAMMLLVSGMMIIVLKYASISSKHTADSYLHEQAELYLNSSIEKALLAISAYDRSGGECRHYFTDSNSSRGKEFRVNITMERYYLYNETCSNVDYTTITTSESHGMVIMDIEVNASIDGVVSTRILRRTLQRP